MPDHGLPACLHPLDTPPQPPGWNHAELADVLGDAALVPAAVLLALRPTAQGPALLFTRRVENLRQHGGQVSFPGGRRDAGDRDALATALRESGEEIGLTPAQVEPLGYLDCFDTLSGYCITPVVARIAADFSARPNPDEVAEMFELPLAWLRQPDRCLERRLDYRGRPRTLYEFSGGPHRIWGATAAILHNLLQRLEGT